MRILSILVFLLFSNSVFTQDYFENRLFIKVKDEQRSVYSLVNDVRFEKILPRALVKSLLPVSKHPLLSSTYELILNESYALDSLVAKIQQLEQIEYAEKVPLYKLFFTPNDPLYSTQWNLAKIQADLAWNLGQGCTQVKIAVTDDGFLMNHEDLVNQWHINTGEINGNGIDDDGNGYIDDWRGWDAANNDNDPSATAPTNSFFTHGTHVAGIVAAQTHNNKGIAAIGYNCKMIPVKIGLSPSSSLTGAFQGLDYAINASGCDVINMSWGGGAWSATFQTLFNIAKSKGIICVAAAGNSNTSTPMYPASYNHVISVAASGSTDARASFSNFGSTIDVTAPGVGIPSCLAGSITSYGNLSGTSMASPLVAGLCGLMKCYNPMPADSIEACLKRTCDNINAQNPTFIGQLGAGRVNAFQALQCLTKKPKSDFIALDTFQCPTKAVRYQAKSFGIPTLTYSWSFPGGSPATSTSANPIVTYATAGYKSATLITCNSLGCDTMTKTNYVNIDTPKAWLNNRVYTTINAMNVVIAVHFKGRSPFSVTLTDGSNTWTQTNIQSNPYLFSIQPKKDTSILSISSFSDSSCAGNKYGQDTIYRKLLTKDTTICVTLKTSQSGALDGFGLSPTSSTNITWTFANNENVVANWTAGGSPHFWRCILKFNLSNIPANAVINSASLSLYSKPNASHGWSGQPTAGTDNSTSISRITNSWTTTSIATNAWPSTTVQNQVTLAQSPTTNHSYTNVNVKNLIQDLINNGDNGIFLRHVNTPFYNSLIFYSAEETDTSKHPKLVLCYTIPAGSSGGGGSSAICESSFQFNGTPTNTVVKIDAKNGAAWKDLYSTNGFTWECWFNLGNRSSSSVTGIESLVGATDAQLCEDIGFHFNWPWAGSGKFNWVVSGQTNCSVPRGVIGTNMTFNANTWYHAAGVMNYSTNTMQLYINGNLVNSGTLTIPMSQRMQNSVAVTIGNQDVNYNPYHTFTPFNGKIDEVRFWNTVRTASEIQANYKQCLAANTPNLVAYFKADEGSGTNTVSKINGNFVGTLQNGATWSTQVDSVKNCNPCGASLCRDSLEVNSAQTGWQALQTNGSWGSLTSCNYVTSLFTANAANFPGMNIGNCLWGPIVANPSRTYYNSSSQTSTSTSNADIAVFRKEISIPVGALIDSVRLWMLSDDFVDSVFINSKNIYTTPIPITYGQVLFTKKEVNIGTGLATNYITIKAGDLGGNYGHYFRMKVYFSKVCNSDCDTSGLVLCMSMDGNANDSTKYNHHGIVRNATLTTGRNGVANSAYYFNGTSSHISLGVKPMLKPSSASISVWVKPHTFNSYTGGNANCILLTKNPNNPGSYMEAYSLYLTNRSGPTKFMTISTHQPTTNEKWFLSNQNTSLNQWTHLVLTFDYDSLKLYINGQLDNKTYKGFNNVYDALDSIMIGYSANTMNKNYFKGDMDELKMYNRVLTSSEVQNLYSKPFTCSCTSSPPPSDCDTSGLVLCMSMDGNANDSTKYAHHGIVRGATPTANRFGINNSAYSFNGISNYIILGNKSLLKPNKATISMWVKPNSISTSGYGYQLNPLFVTGNTNSPGNMCEAYFMGISTSGNTKFHSSSWNPSPSVSSGGFANQSFSLNAWHHMTTTFDNDSLKIYINGVLDKSFYKGFATNYSTIDSIIIAYSGNNTNNQRWFNGSIDDIKMYNRVLTATEVQNLYSKPFTCNCTSSPPPPSDCDTSQLNTGKVLHLDFNGNTQDKSGNNNHATNYGATPVAGKDGVANTAYRFDSTNYMSVTHHSSLNLRSFTVTAILKPLKFNTDICYTNCVVSKGTAAVGAQWAMQYAPTTSTTCFNRDTSNCNMFLCGSVCPPSNSITNTLPYMVHNKWECAVLTYDSITKDVKMYINGVLRHQWNGTFSSLTSQNAAAVLIGKYGDPNYPGHIQAIIDDIRIYNRVLAPSEVKGYCGTCNTTPTQLICNNWLKTLNTNDRVTVGDLDVTGDKLTVEALVNQVDTGSTPSWDDREIVSKHSHGYNINYNLRSSFASVTTDSSLNGKGVAGADFYYTSAICKSSLNKTYHIAMVYDGVKLSFYRNGFLMSQVAAKGNLITNNLLANISNYAGITTGSNNHSTKGYVNEVRIWNVARTQSQIKQFMSDTLPNPASQTGLLGYYRFDNLLNKQGNPTFNGTIVGGAQINQTNPNCTLVIDSCDINSQPPVICDTSRRFTYTQCLNDSLQVTLRAGSQYQWSPKLGLSSDTVRNPKIYVTANQRYLVSYLGAKGCQVIDTIDISVRPSAIYPKMEDQLICIGDSVQMTIPIYATNVQWSPNTNISSITANNPFFYPTVNTTYYLQFRDTFGCLHKDTFVVNTKVCCPARARFSIPKELLCFGEDLTITNRSKGPITGYNWNFGNTIPSSFAGANPPVLKFPAGGAYPLRLIVTNGICFDTMTKIVTVVQVFPNAGKDTTNCLGAFVTDLGESPISDWTYKWTPTIYLDDPNIANPKCSIINDSVNYVVEVTDRNSGCKAYDTVVVYTNRSIDSTSQNLRICNGDSVLFNGIQRKTTGNYYFTIKKADGFCDSFINILRLNVLQKQVIPLDTLRKCEQYIDAEGKKHTQSFIEYDTIRSKSILNCDSMVYIRHIYIYKKAYRDRPPVSGCAPFRYNGKTYTESKMRVDSLVIRNIYLPGCDTIEYINVIVFPKPKAMITPSIPNPVLYKQTVTLSASGGQRYFWLQTGSTNQDIDYKINNTQPKLFTVRVTDENECWDTVSYLVKGILPDTCYYGFPNVFSPNQDNLNDEYIPNMDECTDVIVFAIYDRWGEKVFETNQLKGWNGYFKGRPAPMGVYLYYAEFNTPWGIRKHKGTFTLMR